MLATLLRLLITWNAIEWVQFIIIQLQATRKLLISIEKELRQNIRIFIFLFIFF